MIVNRHYELSLNFHRMKYYPLFFFNGFCKTKGASRTLDWPDYMISSIMSSSDEQSVFVRGVCTWGEGVMDVKDLFDLDN